ncbi:MAG: ATP-binding protein [Alphaproteobacteria bacterium]
MASILRRVLDETIEITINPAAETLFCKVGPGQLETALFNLSINARDAMPTGGRLTIDVRQTGVAVDDTHLPAGTYVTLNVTDTGMPDNVVSRVFEPFYTTKEQGKGTGLGLSMVYEFVKQSAGHITVESEMGQGTRVKINYPFVKVRRE